MANCKRDKLTTESSITRLLLYFGAYKLEPKISSEIFSPVMDSSIGEEKNNHHIPYNKNIFTSNTTTISFLKEFINKCLSLCASTDKV